MKIKIGKFERPSLAQGEHGYAKLYANGEKVGWIERWMKRDFVYGYTGAWAVESYFAMVRRGTEWTHLSESVRGPLGQKLQSAAEAKRALKVSAAEWLVAREAQESVDANEPIEGYLLRACLNGRSSCAGRVHRAGFYQKDEGVDCG